MKVDFFINCENGGVIFAIADALRKAGFNVLDCGLNLVTGEPDIECDPPIDFIDKVPDALVPFVDGGPAPKGPVVE